MKTLWVVLLSCLLLLSSETVFGQNSGISLGIRLGSANGVSAQFLGDAGLGAEALAVYRREGFRLIGLGKWYLPLAFNNDSYLHFGAGGHAGYVGLIGDGQATRAVYGVDLMLGFEYVFPGEPIAFSLDFKPFWELNGVRSFSGNNAGATLRFILN